MKVVSRPTSLYIVVQVKTFDSFVLPGLTLVEIETVETSSAGLGGFDYIDINCNLICNKS